MSGPPRAWPVVVRGVACALLAGAISVACTEPEASGPPVLRPGLDVCAECGMSIVDTEFAAGVLVERGGHREHLVFDDLGCLLVWESDPSHAVLDRWTMTLDSKAWVVLSSANIVAGSSRRTPMDSGIMAFEQSASATAAVAADGGAVTPFDQLEVPEAMRP